MNRVLFALFCALVVAVAAENEAETKEVKFHTWALLVAGSKGYKNYRHQADVCHMYQAIHNLGVPEEQIIVMMEDDLVYNTKNVYPGALYNTLDGPYGENVYQGVPHDYTHNLVTAENFQKILLGQEMTVGSGKTLKTGPEDNIIVFYSDHGNTDMIAFPDESEFTSADFKNTINWMAGNNTFKNLVFFIEACYSGSLFYTLDLPPNVFVTTAAPVGISSYGYCGGFCDLYSLLLISDLESAHPKGYTLRDQFENIVDAMHASQGCSYGGSDLSQMTLEELFGPSFTSNGRSVHPLPPVVASDLIPNEKFELWAAKRDYEKNPSAENRRELNKQIAIQNHIDAMGISIVSAAMPHVPRLATVPCTVCDDSCDCYYLCIDDFTADYCTFECCNEDSCLRPYGSSSSGHHMAGTRESVDEESCVLTLSRELRGQCRMKHPYLLSLELQFRRVCRQSDVNISSAVNEIRRQCASFDAASF